MKETETYALLQLRTLKGGLRLVSLPAEEKATWRIDIGEEGTALRQFLQGPTSPRYDPGTGW